MASQVMLSTRLVISSTAQPFSAKAPVGQTCTHLPQFVQLRAWPEGRFRSHEIMERMPREATSSTCAPSTSSQTRTHRVHRMQRLWSSTNPSCDLSTGSSGSLYGYPTEV